MSGGGSPFSIDLGVAQSVLTIFQNIDNEVNQYAGQLNTAVQNLQGNWQGGTNQQSFNTDWTTYWSAICTVQSVGPNLVNGLTNEINLVQQAEGVQY